MARTNVARKSRKTTPPVGTTYEGCPAPTLTNEQVLRRSVAAGLLWEDSFYEDGETHAERLMRLALAAEPRFLAELAVETRWQSKIRHTPLWLLVALAKTGRTIPGLVSSAVYRTIGRPDEMGELLALYKKANGFAETNFKIPSQFVKGLAAIFENDKFSEFQFSKWNRDAEIPLRAVLHKAHPKPRTTGQAELWGKIRGVKAEGAKRPAKLETADTHLVALSVGEKGQKKTAEDKKTVWERLLREGKIPYQALLMNLRGMADAGVDDRLIRSAILARKGGADRILPFRFVSAMRAAPQFVTELNESFLTMREGGHVLELPGMTWILVDVSGSMEAPVSKKGTLSRMDAAAALAVLFKGRRRVITFSSLANEVPAFDGLAGIDAIINSQWHGGTYIAPAMEIVKKTARKGDRLIVISDEQVADRADPAVGRAYMINVGTYQNGVGYGPKWLNISGWSEHVLDYILEYERI